ncbi:hypothetical protein PaeBR_14550 [Paenibacillus sp. BR2-3]|uniref:siroheme decarboxylase subunit beta n=1 Tax=Paenibacillus sp. BR2-3 TaxID=3048494 RepID=UPI0039778A80
MKLDVTDRILLNRLQVEIPLVTQPWRVVAEELGIQQEEVLQRLESLKNQGVIRRIGGVFNPAGLGYTGRLYAMQVAEDRFYTTAAVVNSYKGVTHNYRRRNWLNMWFTLTARTEEERRAMLEPIREAAGNTQLYEFPAEQVFKLKLFLNMEGKPAATNTNFVQEKNNDSRFIREQSKIDTLDLLIIRELQGDLPLLTEPYHEVARRTGCRVEEVILRLQRLQAGGALKRVGVILKHRKVGFSANGLFVCVLPEEKINEAGQRLASFEEVSHCYKRQSYPEWPYNVYAMIHGATEAEVQQIVEGFIREKSIESYDILFSTEELKKTSFSI